MKATFKKFATALGLVLIGTILTATASAECGSYVPGRNAGPVVTPQSWSGPEFSSASLLMVSERESNDSAVVAGESGLGSKRTHPPASVASPRTIPSRFKVVDKSYA